MEIHNAVCAADVEKVQALIAKGADVNAKEDEKIWGFTPLHYAVRFGYMEIVRLLLAHGADPNTTCRFGLTPSHLARCGRRKEEIIDLLRQHGGADVAVQLAF